jgi:hypothetical protein
MHIGVRWCVLMLEMVWEGYDPSIFGVAFLYVVLLLLNALHLVN